MFVRVFDKDTTDLINNSILNTKPGSKEVPSGFLATKILLKSFMCTLNPREYISIALDFTEVCRTLQSFAEICKVLRRFAETNAMQTTNMLFKSM